MHFISCQLTVTIEWIVFATTASNPTESSYACYYDDTRQTYLGDLYSVDWMEDSDKGLIGNETLLSQFQIVQQETIFSTVCDYGNLVWTF